MEEKILLTDLLDACLNFKKEPIPANEVAVKSITSRFVIKEYIPVVRKMVQISLILSTLNTEEFDEFDTETRLTVGKVVYGILGYVDNIENDLNTLAMSAAIVDLLYEFGIIDEILAHCGKDYARLDKMVDETLNFSNLFRLAETVSLISPENINAFIKEIESIKSELTPENLDKMKSIANATAPEFQALKETLVDEALGKAMDKDFDKLKTEEPKPAEPEKQAESEEPKEETEEKGKLDA